MDTEIKEVTEITFVYQKNSDHKTFHVDGGQGGITSKGNIQLNLFQDNMPMPTTETNKVNEDGNLGELITQERAAPNVVSREVLASVIMTPAIAKVLGEWLLKRVEQYETLAEEYQIIQEGKE